MEDDSQEAKAKKDKIHQPEYIILDREEKARQEGFYESYKEGEYIEVLNKLGQKKYSWLIRLFIFMSALFVSIACFFVFFLALVHTVLALLTVFLNKEINASLYRSWCNVRKSFVMLLGLLIGVFSPPLGLGLVILDLMLHKENLRKNFLFTRVFH